MEIEETLCIFKPDLLQRYNYQDVLEEIKKNFNEDHFELKKLGSLTLAKEDAHNLYEEHQEKGFFNDMVGFMTQGPCFVFVLKGNNIISRYRQLIGATDPKKADVGTLRNKYGKSIDENSFHGSDSLNSANREIQIFLNIFNLEK